MRPIRSKTRLSLRTICEIHREMYRELKQLGFDDSSKAVKLLLEAYPIGKKMWSKLRQYKHGFDNGWYEKNKFDGPKIDE